MRVSEERPRGEGEEEESVMERWIAESTGHEAPASEWEWPKQNVQVIAGGY